MEQNNLLEYLYKRLKNDKLWFVTKNDVSSSWENKPKKYYTLDEYGEIKDKSKVEKEINDYIGDGAETIQEAVSLFIADKVCDGSITTTDYLTTEFKDKPVEYTDTAVEVKNVEPKYVEPEITGSNKQVESKQLNEDIFDDVSNGKATYGVYDDKDTRNYKDRYKEPTYAKRNKIRNFKDNKFKQRSVRDIINKGVTHVDYEKMPNERVQAYKNSKKEEDKEFIPDEMEDYKKSYIDKYHKIPKKMEWKYMAGDVDGIKIDGKIYIFNIETKKCLGTFDEFKSNDFKTESVKGIGNIQRRLDESSLNDIANYIKGIVDYDVNITPTGKGFSSYDVNFLNTDGSIMYSVAVNDFAVNDKVILLNTLIIGLDRFYRGKTFADIIREKLLDELNKIHPINKKVENVQRRLEEENNKSLNLISDMFKSKDFDSDSKAGQIVMRTSSLFNALSDKGYDVQVAFDNGESTNTILLGQQGGSILITITDTNQPLRAFTDGSFEITEDNIKILDDVRKEIETI